MVEVWYDDPELKGLDICWDGDKMLPVLREALQSATSDVRIESCQMDRLRYRPATRAISLYKLRVRNINSDAAVSTWITGTSYPGNRAHRKLKRIRNSVSESVNPVFDLKPFANVPELGMLLQVFPNDRALPSLSGLVTSPETYLSSPIANEFGPGDWDLYRWEVEPVRYRPFLRATLMINVAARRPGTQQIAYKSFYLKVFREGEADPALKKLLALRKDAARLGHYRVVEPIDYLEPLSAILFRKASGRCLQEYLLKSDANSTVAYVQAAAEALVQFHHCAVPDLPVRTLAERLDRARKAAAFIRWSCPGENIRLNQIMSKLEIGLGVRINLPTHLDIKPDHFFVSPEGVTFLDLDSCGLSDPVFDVAMMAARLEELPLLEGASDSVVQLASQQFIRTYFDGVPSGWRARYEINLVAAKLKVALFYIQHQTHDWRSRVNGLLKACAQLLS